MQIIPIQSILPRLRDKKAVLSAVREGIIAHSQGTIASPPPVQMIFSKEGNSIVGDCHVKAAFSRTHPYFCIKVATGFYGNSARDLPVNNGLVMLLSAESGKPLALFQDEWHLTSIRTAAAGALAASLAVTTSPIHLGILGVGNQAELQAKWITAYIEVSKISLWGRTASKAKLLVEQLRCLSIPINLASSPNELALLADIIVTTTPSTAPIICSKDIRPGHHIVAIGSDTPGKIELDPVILKKADVIYTDDHQQCLAHGEFGNAVRQGYVEESSDKDFGKALRSGQHRTRKGPQISIVDLTGLGAQDLAITSFLYEQLMTD